MKRYFVDFAMGFTWDILDASLSKDALKALSMGIRINPCEISVFSYSLIPRWRLFINTRDIETISSSTHSEKEII